MKIQDVRQAVADLEKRGLTALDLFSWVYLLDLRARYKAFEGVDLDIHYLMQQDINEALWKKARLLDEDERTTWHQDFLRKTGIPETVLR